LGLALVKEIAEAHHGRIIVESKVNQGSTFHIYFPCIEKGEQTPLRDKNG
jgi:signal transduction histidine kinase